MKKNLSKILIISIIIELIFASYAQLLPYWNPPIAKAATENVNSNSTGDDESADTEDVNVPDEGDEPPVQTTYSPKLPSSVASLSQTDQKYTDSSGDAGSFTYDDILGVSSTNQARIVLPQKDLAAIRSLQCLTEIVPEYNEDFDALYRDLPEKNILTIDPAVVDKRLATKTWVDQEVNHEKTADKPRYKDYNDYFNYLKNGDQTISVADKFDNREYFGKLIEAAQMNFTGSGEYAKLAEIWSAEANSIAKGIGNSVEMNSLACVSGLDVNYLTSALRSSGNQDRQRVADTILKRLQEIVIDIRVFKTLVYLVTPKNQGGAGHRRIKVNRILQNQDKSGESDATLSTLYSNGKTKTQTACTSEMTAAECGQANNQQPDGEVEDQDGSAYNMFLDDQRVSEDQFIKEQRNVSAHTSGQAIDIQEIDDIRCTLVEKKRIGGSKKKEQPIRPIKLAWQTTDGYNKTGGSSDFDMAAKLKDAARESVIELLDTLDGDTTDYEGDLSRANFDDLLGILGQSMLGQVANTPGYSLKGINIESTLKNLGAVYVADYLGLPREIFNDIDLTKSKDIETVKYKIGRTAVEKKLGLPFGSLDNFDWFGSNNSQSESKVTLYNLQGLLTNVGLTKIEYELGLKSGDLSDFMYDRTNYSVPTQVAMTDAFIGAKVIENELNFPKKSWPPKADSFVNLKYYVSDLRVKLFKEDPGYIDSVLHIDSGTTQNFISGKINSENFAEMVGKNRVSDTMFGLKYFAMNNAAYQLPGPTKDNPNLPDTWAEAIKGNYSAIKEVGIFTLARLLGQNSLSISLKDENGENILLEGETKQKITLSEAIFDGAYTITSEYKREDFGFYVFRNWLRDNLKTTSADACKSKRGDINLTITTDAGTINQDIDFQSGVELQKSGLCPLTEKISYDLYYKSKDGHDIIMPKTNSEVFDISEEKAIGAGLETLDLYRIAGFADADGRSVFERIGSKMLYYGIANQLLSDEERAKIDLTDTDPTLQVDNSTVNFYLTRVIKSAELSQKIKNEWNIIKTKDDKEVKEISDRVDRILGKLTDLYNDKDSDLLKTSKILQAARDLAHDIDELKQSIKDLRDYYDVQATAEGQKKVGQINIMIIDVNSLIKNLSEIIAGKAIPVSDLITIDKIDASKLNNSTDNGSGRRSGKGLSGTQTTLLIFDWLSGKVDTAEMILRIGANKAEAQYGLPSNSLIYLVQNYEDRGMTGIDTLYQAVGQARIEEQFNMPMYYFQGDNLSTKRPDFNSNMTALYDYNMKADNGVQLNKEIDNFINKQFPKHDNCPAMNKGTFEFSFWSVNPDCLKLTADGKIELLSMMRVNIKDGWFGLFNLTRIANNKWQADRDAQIAKYGSGTIGEVNLDDIVANIKTRKFNGIIRSPEDDLLFRMGLPVGKYNQLRNSDISTWTALNGQATSIDQLFDIKYGSTKSMFTGKTPVDTKAITQKEKNLLESSSLKLPKNLVEKYIQLVNGDILPGDANLLGFEADYVSNNPYAKQKTAGSDCPIAYSLKDGFLVNEETLENNSFCYYDKAGRHCFQSLEEAQKYQNNHPADKMTDVLDYLASAIENVSSGKIKSGSLKSGILDFINNKNIYSIFGSSSTNTEDIFKTVAENSTVDISVLKRLFSRQDIGKSVPNYKEMVGKIEAEKILTTHLFDELDLDIDPNLFDAGDFYDLLTGNYSSLYRLGSNYIDKSLDLKPGTTMLIYTARSADARKCALNQAGGMLLGELFGLNYVPITGLTTKDFVSNIGETKIEETLSLPRGTFRGKDLDEVIKNVGPINFALAFKMPIFSLDQDIVKGIVGEKEYKRIQNTSPQYQLKKVQDYLLSQQLLSNVSYGELRKFDDLLTSEIKAIFKVLSSTDANASIVKMISTPDELLALMDIFVPGISAAIKQSESKYNKSKIVVNYNNQVPVFFNQIKHLDTLFSLPVASTYNLLIGKTIPQDYINKIGNKMVLNVGLVKLGEALGLSTEQSQEAADLITRLQSIFTCQSGWYNGQCGKGTISVTGNRSANLDPYYHNWGYLYGSLDKLFNFNLDEKAQLPKGTIAKIAENPNNTFPILAEIGAAKLDAQLSLDPTKTASVTGLYKALFTKDMATEDKKCHTEAYASNGINEDELNYKMINAQNEVSRLKSLYKDSFTTEETATWKSNYDKAINAVNEIQAKYNQIQNDEKICQIAARQTKSKTTRPGDMSQSDWETYGQRAWEWAQQAAAETIHDKIANVTVKDKDGNKVNVGIDMPTGDIRQLMRGDLRYLQVAGYAMGANIAMVVIDGINIKNCNPDEKTDNECRMPVPAEFRITYEDISMATFGIPDDSAAGLIVFNYINKDEKIGILQPNPEGDKKVSFVTQSCPTGTAYDGLACVSTVGTSGDLVRDVQEQINYENGYTPENVETARQYLQTQIQKGAEYCNTKDDSQKASCMNGTLESGLPNVDHLKDSLDHLNNPEEYYKLATQEFITDANGNKIRNPEYKEDLVKKKKALDDSAKSKAFDNFKYQMMDIMLWKLDANVFPGFARVMMTGNSSERMAALAMYIKNGLRNGHLFGMNFDAVDPTWINIGLDLGKWFFGNTAQKDAAFADLVNSGGYNTLSNYIAKNSEKWFGFSIQPNMAQGLLTGIFSGDWGIKAISLDGAVGMSGHETVTIGKKTIPTLGGALVDWGMGRLFSWADKALGLPPGQSYSVFKGAVDTYRAIVAFNNAAKAIKAAEEALAKANQLLKQAKTAEEISKAKGAVDAASKELASKAAEKTAASAKASAAATAVAQLIIGILVDKLLGKTISAWEDSLGLVPGSLAPLISTGIYYAIAPTLNAIATGMGYAGGNLFALGPAGLYFAIAMFIIMNLFGVYKTEYWCTNDGYFPKKGSAPAGNDISGMGEWGGNVKNSNLNKILQQKQIQSAQYKARRLIGDMLEMQYNPIFNDSTGRPTFPVQIMTGRKEDVEYWNNLINTNMCKLGRGKNSKAIYQDGRSICDGNTRFGVWYNPQVVGFTHIGF